MTKHGTMPDLEIVTAARASMTAPLDIPSEARFACAARVLFAAGFDSLEIAGVFDRAEVDVLVLLHATREASL